ncbi:hypothetical protein D4764_14G0009570 [Takifugu flavidus]|uniref:Uncharacterized protein n=1 Tax=Takifugu flavidus TaxID=433684 RepID=A0A5C6P576_9TELE|nr:hypothetical protein D4764_14G0009570 [Takifugu flavidus]
MACQTVFQTTALSPSSSSSSPSSSSSSSSFLPFRLYSVSREVRPAWSSPVQPGPAPSHTQQIKRRKERGQPVDVEDSRPQIRVRQFPRTGLKPAYWTIVPSPQGGQRRYPGRSPCTMGSRVLTPRARVLATAREDCSDERTPGTMSSASDLRCSGPSARPCPRQML